MGNGVLELYAYAMSYKQQADNCAALGGIVTMHIARGWEFRAFRDGLSW